MPTLAQQIVLGNKAGGKPQVNLKGVFVGFVSICSSVFVEDAMLIVKEHSSSFHLIVY